MVDLVDELILKGSITISTHEAFFRDSPDYENKCIVYECDNLTKYKTANNNTDSFLYALSAQYGSQKCEQNVNYQFPPNKVKLTRANHGKENNLIRASDKDSVINDVSDLDYIQNIRVPY